MSNPALPPSPLTPNGSAQAARSLPRWLEPLLLLGPAGLWLLLLLIAPALVILELSLVPNIRPGGIVNPSGLDNYLLIFQPIYLQVVLRSLLFAAGTTIVCLMLGFPVAYWIALAAPKRWQNLLLLGFILPLWTSSLLRSYAWITILRPTGVVNILLSALRLPELDLLNTGVLDFLKLLPFKMGWAIALTDSWLNLRLAVFIGMSYSLLPYMVLILYASLEKLDRRLLEAAADLGAGPQATFWRVTVPQTLPGIAAGCLLVFITGLGDFVDPELLGGASSMTAARLIYNQFLGATQNWGFGSALSMILVLGVSIAIFLLLKYGDPAATKE